MEVTLSFDNGPEPAVTPRVLEVLEQFDVKATFFVLGRIFEEKVVLDEILDTQALVGELAHPDRLFRPFGGGGEIGSHLLNQTAVRILELHDLPTGAMGRLRIFIDRVLDHGGRFRRDFPPQCVPLLRGRRVGALEPYLS